MPIQDDAWLRPFAQTFHTAVLWDRADPRLLWFYGMRDVYAVVAMLQVHCATCLAGRRRRAGGNGRRALPRGARLRTSSTGPSW